MGCDCEDCGRETPEEDVECDSKFLCEASILDPTVSMGQVTDLRTASQLPPTLTPLASNPLDTSALDPFQISDNSSSTK